jgi:hypothetical protein
MLVCSGGSAVSAGSDVAYPFKFELRVAKSVRLNVTNTQVSLVAHHGEDATFLWACKQTNDGELVIFQRDFVIFSEDKPQRGLIVTTFPADVSQGCTAQVFRLSIPQSPEPTGWSQWQRPNYLELGAAGWTFFVPDSKAKNRSTNIPSDCFQLRYRIEAKKIE